MRFRGFLLFVAVLFLVVSFLPGIVLRSIPKVDYTRVSLQNYASEVQCLGKIEQQGKKQVFVKTPVIADEVLVQPGDIVQKGDVLAEIDTSLTQQVLAESVIVEKKNSNKQTTELTNQELERILKAAALYGVSSDMLSPLMESAGDSLQSVQPASDTLLEAIPSKILSPMDGVVLETNLDSGMLTKTSEALFTVADGNRFRVKSQVNESQIQTISLGDCVSIDGVALNRVYSGFISGISPSAKQNASTIHQAIVDVYIDILDPDDSLKENYSVNTRIHSLDSREIMALPYEAVEQDTNGEYVWAIKNSRAVKQYILTGEEFIDGVEIVQGLQPDDIIIVDPDGIHTNSRVRLGSEMKLS